MNATDYARVPFLDGIRGYAALWVVLGHVSFWTGFSLPFVSNPALAVDVFMIMSGFLMTQHFFLRRSREPWNSPRTWFIFYIRRFFRSAPLYYQILIPSSLLFGYFAQRKESVGAVSAAVDLQNVLLHVTFLFGLSPRFCASLIIPDWSIGLEMQFYLVFPFLMVLASRINMARFSALVLPVWIVARHLITVYSGSRPGLLGWFPQPSLLPLKIGLFLIGMALAWACMEREEKTGARTFVIALIVMTTASIAGGFVVASTVLFSLMLFYNEASMGMGLGRVIENCRRFFGNAVAHLLAEVSYGVYLLHMLILYPARQILGAAPWYMRQPALVRFCVLAAVVLPIVYGLSWVLFRLVETPGIRLGKTIVDRFRTAGGQAALVKGVAVNP